MTRSVAILLFDDVEVLDFAGPFEVFSVCGLRSGQAAPFHVFTVAERRTVRARNNLVIEPTYELGKEPAADILLIPGGGGYTPEGLPLGTRREMENPAILNWIREHNQRCELLLSVCTGSLLLAKAGLLEGLAATTHWLAVEKMSEVAPNTRMLPQERWVDNGRIILSAGISAGIDMSFHVVERLLGKDAALETARYMQYDYYR